MAKNTLQDLRDHLFAALESLSDEEKPMEIERARAICAVSGRIIDTAKVEMKYLEIVGEPEQQKRTEKFFSDSSRLPVHNSARVLPS